MFEVLASVRKTQMNITQNQCKSMEAAVRVLSKMIDKQSKVLEEIKINANMRQLQYEVTLNMIAEQQRQTIELLEKHFKDSYVNVNS
tara:strand:- start:188 stop:448 length:261 start_codon:yes stop_codon:yes gene_type:complete